MIQIPVFGKQHKVGDTMRFDYSRVMADGSVIQAGVTYEVTGVWPDGIAWCVSLRKRVPSAHSTSLNYTTGA